MFTTKASTINQEIIPSEAKHPDKDSFQQAIQSQEFIDINSALETEIQEPKKFVNMLWKQREQPDIKAKLTNEGWLTKHYPSDGLEIPNTIETFRKEMLSTDAWPFERDNERYTTSLSTADFHLMKHSSPSIISSKSILSPNSSASTVQLSSGKELCPRVLQDVLCRC